MSGQKPREIAARVLQRRVNGGFIEDLLDEALRGAALTGADRGLCQELAYGVVRWQRTLDWLISRKTGNRDQKPMLQILLALGLYQLLWLDRIPDYAAVNSTVDLARQLGFGQQAGFVNAVLRGYVRDKEPTRKALDELKVTDPGLGYSHPEWLAQKWRARWGDDNARKLLDLNNTPAKIYARVNQIKTDPGKLIELWRAENITYDFVRRDWLEDNLVFELKSHPALHELPSMQQGLFYVQDPSTLMAVAELDVKPGQAILDFCAAPGGKLTYIAQMLGPEGYLVGQDPVPERLGKLRQNCQRMGVTAVDFQQQINLQGNAGRFDRVLIDAPCSNTGVMRRRVDLRWRISEAEILRLTHTQLDLLTAAAPLLKSGGLLVYSTCSLEPEENSGVVGQFLERNADYSLERERSLLPFADGVDGAYAARLRKR